MFPHHLNVAVA